MIWPPSVQGILVTEGVRGEGGVLRNNEGKRFMFDDIPGQLQERRPSTDPEEGWRYTQNDKNARRPPELLTRDHVARCINREVKAGRGSPHGGVFLDISWIKEKLPNAAEHIKKKLPSMYHQFMQLGESRHHQGADGSRPDHALRHGRRARERRHADVERARPLRRGRMRRGPARRESPGRQFALRSARLRQARRRIRREVREGKSGRHASTTRRSRRPRGRRSRPSSAARTAAPARRVPTQVQHELQDMMQDAGRHRPHRGRNAAGAGRISASFWERADQDRRLRPSRVQSRLAHRARSRSICSPFPRPSPARRSSARKAAAAISARISRTRSAEDAKVNIVISKGADGSMQLRREPIPPMPEELKQVIEEMANEQRSPFASGAARRARAASSSITRPRSPKAWSCSTSSTRSRPRRPTTSPAAGTARPASAAPARRRSTASRA